MKEINIEEEQKPKRRPRKGSLASKKDVEKKEKETKKASKEKEKKAKKDPKEKTSKPKKEAKAKKIKEPKVKKDKDTGIEVTNFADELSSDDKKENKKKTKKKISKLTIFLIILYLILCGGVIYGGYFLGNKYALINVTKLNKKDLGINNHAFDEANTNLTRKQFDQIKTIAVFGTDNRARDKEGSRSDVNMVISINPTMKSIKMISVPRDTHVQIRGSKDKMGHAYFYGGPTLAINTLNQNFGLNITDYATIDFYGVINAINKLGGVELDITQAEMNYINEWTHESYGFSGKPYKKLTKYGPKTLLNGEETLAHARNRTIGNDFVRTQRQRQVLTAIINKLSEKSLGEILELVDTMLKEVETNANITDYFAIVPSMLANKDEYLAHIISGQVPDLNNLHTEMINGLSCVVPNSMPIARKQFQDYIYNK